MIWQQLSIGTLKGSPAHQLMNQQAENSGELPPAFVSGDLGYIYLEQRTMETSTTCSARDCHLCRRVRSVTHGSGPDMWLLVPDEGLEPPTY